MLSMVVHTCKPRAMEPDMDSVPGIACEFVYPTRGRDQ